MLSNKEHSSNQNLATDGAVQQSTDNIYPHHLRGEKDIDGETMSNMDRRLGVPVPVGTTVLLGELDVCQVIGGTDELLIVRDTDGHHHAEQIGACWVQAGSFAGQSLASGAHERTAPPLHALDPAAVDRVRRDPFREASLRVLDIAKLIEQLDTEYEQLVRDQAATIETLHDAYLKLTDIADNREAYILGMSVPQQAEGGAQS